MNSTSLENKSKLFGLVFGLFFFVPVTALSILAIRSDWSQSTGNELQSPTSIKLTNDTDYRISKVLVTDQAKAYTIELSGVIESHQTLPIEINQSKASALPCSMDTTIGWDDGDQTKIGTLNFCTNANKTLVVRYPTGTGFE
jgi:hypothetical protein